MSTSTKKPARNAKKRNGPRFILSRKAVPISWEAGGSSKIDWVMRWHVTMKAGNNEITWTTETRPTKHSCMRAINWLKKHAASAPVVDLAKKGGK